MKLRKLIFPLALLIFGLMVLLPGKAEASFGQVTLTFSIRDASGNWGNYSGVSYEVSSNKSDAYQWKRSSNSGGGCFGCSSSAVVFGLNDYKSAWTGNSDSTGYVHLGNGTSKGFACGNSDCGDSDLGDCNPFKISVRSLDESKRGGIWDIYVHGDSHYDQGADPRSTLFNISNDSIIPFTYKYYPPSPPKGNLSCRSSTQNSITLNYSYSGVANGYDTVALEGPGGYGPSSCWSGPSGSGTYTYGSLNPGTAYKFHLRYCQLCNPLLSLSPLASITCSTLPKETFTRYKCNGPVCEPFTTDDPNSGYTTPNCDNGCSDVLPRPGQAPRWQYFWQEITP